MDALICIDEIECKKGLQLLTDPAGVRFLTASAGVPEKAAREIATIFGISGVCNLLGAIKAAKYFGLTARDTLVTVATDAIDRYRSVMEQLDGKFGRLDPTEAAVRLESIFHGQKTDWVQEGTEGNRQRWFNLKYYTWVEQQGKTVGELDAQRDPAWWTRHQELVAEQDEKLRKARTA
jgi:cysteine synthase A